MIYKIRFVSHLKVIGLILMVGLILIPYLYYRSTRDNDYSIFYFCTGLFLVASLSLVYVHLEYYFKNKGMSIEFDKSTSFFSIFQKNEVLKIHYDQIAVIENHQTQAYATKTRRILLTDNYHYTKIILDNGNQIYITSLLCSNFDLGLINKEKNIKRVIAIIALEKNAS